MGFFKTAQHKSLLAMAAKGSGGGVTAPMAIHDAMEWDLFVQVSAISNASLDIAIQTTPHELANATIQWYDLSDMSQIAATGNVFSGYGTTINRLIPRLGGLYARASYTVSGAGSATFSIEAVKHVGG